MLRPASTFISRACSCCASLLRVPHALVELQLVRGRLWRIFGTSSCLFTSNPFAPPVAHRSGPFSAVSQSVKHLIAELTFIFVFDPTVLWKCSVDAGGVIPSVMKPEGCSRLEGAIGHTLPLLFGNIAGVRQVNTTFGLVGGSKPARIGDCGEFVFVFVFVCGQNNKWRQVLLSASVVMATGCVFFIVVEGRQAADEAPLSSQSGLFPAGLMLQRRLRINFLKIFSCFPPFSVCFPGTGN